MVTTISSSSTACAVYASGRSTWMAGFREGLAFNMKKIKVRNTMSMRGVSTSPPSSSRRRGSFIALASGLQARQLFPGEQGEQLRAGDLHAGQGPVHPLAEQVEGQQAGNGHAQAAHRGDQRLGNAAGQ